MMPSPEQETISLPFVLGMNFALKMFVRWPERIECLTCRRSQEYHMIAVWMEEHVEAIISYDLPSYCTGYWWPERCRLTPRGCIHQCHSSKLCWPAEFGVRWDSHAKNVSFWTNDRKLLSVQLNWSWIMTSWTLPHPQNQLWWNISRQGVVSKFKQVTD